MSAISTIEWTDRTWNPVRGCSVVSPGCVNCYAMKFAHRFSGEGKPYEGLTKQTKAGPQWTGKIRLVEDVLTEPLKWRKPQRVFVNSMSDLFHETVPDEWIDRIFAVMALCPHLTFQVLTKRSKRMREYFDGDMAVNRVADVIGCGLLPSGHTYEHRSDVANRLLGQAIAGRGFDDLPTWPLPNVWLGVSAEDQQRADERIPLLLQTPAAVRFVSAEPLIGPIDLRLGQGFCRACKAITAGSIEGHCMDPKSPCFAGEMGIGDGIDWVIVGGESGPGARPSDVDWIHPIVRQCEAAGVALFVKQLGRKSYQTNAALASPLNRIRKTDGNYWLTLRDRKGGDPSEWPEDLRVRQFPEARR